MRILIITDKIPYPAVSGTLLRIYHLCRTIASTQEVWLAAPLNKPEDADGVSHMLKFCAEVISADRQRLRPVQHLPGLLHYAIQGKPWEYKFEHCEELVQKIRHLTAKVEFDIAQIEPSYMGLYLEAISDDARCKKSIIFHNIESSLFRQQSRVYRAPLAKLRAFLHSVMLRRWESTYTKKFDFCITVSEEDRRLLRRSNPRLQIEVVPNGVDTQAYQSLPYENTTPALLFVGSMNYRPNADAALYLCQQILPRIRRAASGVETWIVGRDPVPEVRHLDGDSVHVTGQVDEVRSYYRRSAVCVVPLRAGGGSRLKILEAMALGRPVVSTSKGCEGLDVIDGEHLLIADDPEQFAKKTVLLLSDEALRQRITDKARKLVETRFDWSVIGRKLLQIYAKPEESS